MRSIPGVCEVHLLRGPAAPADAPPSFFVEVPHGADESAHYLALAARMRSALPPDLIDFFHVNTDVGAWDLGLSLAQRLVAARPERVAVAIRCLLPRTLVDCNRVLRPPGGVMEDGLTPGLAPWVRDPADQALLTELHAAYLGEVNAAWDAVVAAGGLGVTPHSYAPRSVGVDRIDDDIAARMREVWSPEQVSSWPLRPQVDLLTEDMDARDLSPPGAAAALLPRYEALGIEVTENHAYRLHPITQGHALAARAPGRLLCFELRRDLLVKAWTPFAEMHADPEAIARLGAPLVEVFDGLLAARGL
ncbi:MAG: hypothetical protein H6740_15315 [Alphaproteobacteria bacterium]|nr:hypothetical protein [Alphaproteobacteria bacterium]